MGSLDTSRGASRVGSSRAHQALGAALGSRGFATGDFELEEHSSDELSDLLGEAGGILTVRCRSTGEERFYSTGSGSAWFGAFLMDLGGGVFAGAARETGSEAPLTRSLNSTALNS